MKTEEAIEQIKKISEYPGTYPCAIVRTPNVIEVIKSIDEPQITDEQAWNKIAEAYPETAQSLRITLDHAVFGQEAESQKVKVPAFVAPFIEKLKITKRRYGVELEKAYKNEEDEELVNWLWFNENVLTLFRALEKGYEVEEEPKWVVKVDDNAYFVDFFDSLTPHLVDGLGWEVMRFDDKSKADAVALIIGGTVEKV